MDILITSIKHFYCFFFLVFHTKVCISGENPLFKIVLIEMAPKICKIGFPQHCNYHCRLVLHIILAFVLFL
jgi:hypothetical protein